MCWQIFLKGIGIFIKQQEVSSQFAISIASSFTAVVDG